MSESKKECWFVDKEHRGLIRLKSDPTVGVIVGIRARSFVDRLNALAGIDDPKGFVKAVDRLVDYIHDLIDTGDGFLTEGEMEEIKKLLVCLDRTRRGGKK